MKALFDTNVVLDLLLGREPHATDAALLFSNVESGVIEGYLGATTITTVHYLSAKAVGRRRAGRHIELLLDLFSVAPVDGTVLRAALASRIVDYEDAVLHAAAINVRVEAIVTRNIRDFRQGSLKVLAPNELARSI